MKKIVGIFMVICLTLGTAQGQKYKKAIAFDYSPLLSSFWHYYDNFSEIYIFYTATKSSLNLELSYRFLPKLSAYIQSGWTRNYNRYRKKNYFIYDDDYNDNDSSGYDMTSSISTFKLIVGTRLYFSKYDIKIVQPFLIAEIGKQFAWAIDKYEDLYPPEEPTSSSDDNYEEYLEGKYSPIFGVFGLGAEYYFNESLSIFTNVRFIYRETYAAYWENTQYNSYYDEREETREYWDIEVNTRVGFGLRFYL